ncbi:SixA phosphatase family protein [Streptosporangium lutulentum]|uniref:Phosphohistidine phosphatase n=1 Tax=Streptosporangium lutulentum TaxID=1461250 RepID=A0ABT9Q702_9ACTN|nr:histidine phosphatase family protein [Streptosporangium lutulentum]MDP9842522.1 phosphohistidine phosphatase [Streptosporangium lutulentum]
MTVPTPRRLIVLRHAKSAWPDVNDFERPLAPRGRRDAPAAGHWLRDSGCLPDHVVCSPARRTRQTWDLVAQELGATPPILYDERVYGASVHVLLDVVREVAEPVRTLLLIGHNPGLQELTLALAGEAAGDAIERVEEKFPTSAIAVLTFEGSWPELAPASALLTDLAVPRGKKKS